VQLLGSNYEQAMDLINSGSLDFLKEQNEEQEQQRSFQQVGECGK
jgi:hypothetical protein